MLIKFGLILGVLYHAHAALPSDFFYNIDGISVDLSQRYFCTIEQTEGHDMGGSLRCFGDDKIIPPKVQTVSICDLKLIT